MCPGSCNCVGLVLGMRRFRRGLITVVVVAVLAVGAVIAFRVVDERRDPVALTAGVVVDHVTCLAPEVLVAAVSLGCSLRSRCRSRCLLRARYPTTLSRHLLWCANSSNTQMISARRRFR